MQETIEQIEALETHTILYRMQSYLREVSGLSEVGPTDRARMVDHANSVGVLIKRVDKMRTALENVANFPCMMQATAGVDCLTIEPPITYSNGKRAHCLTCEARVGLK